MSTPSPRAAQRWKLTGWLDAHEVQRTGRARPVGSLLRVVLVYLLGFGLPVVAAVEYVALPRARALAHTASGWRPTFVLQFGLLALAVVVALWLLAREAPSWARPIPRGRWWTAQLKAAGLGWLAMAVGAFTVSTLGAAPYPRSPAAGSAWPNLVNSLLAGPGEEVVVLVLPLVFLRAAKWPWWAVITAGVVLRLAYHAYYGYAALGWTVWALAMIFIYLRAHAVIGLVVAHSFWDLTGTVGEYWSRVAEGLMWWLPLLSLIVWGVVSLTLYVVRRSQPQIAAQLAAPRTVGWYQNEAGHWWWWDGRGWLAATPPPTDAES